MTRANLATLAAACAVSVSLACALVGERERSRAWESSAHYAARLAVSHCRTDAECEHAADVADDYGVPAPIYLPEYQPPHRVGVGLVTGWHRADFLQFE